MRNKLRRQPSKAKLANANGVARSAPCSGHPSSDTLSAWLIGRLLESGHRMTRARRLLVDALATHFPTDPFSAQTLIDKLDSRQGVDRVTVYRSLQTLTDLKLIHATHLGDGSLYYVLGTPDGHHHHRVVCTVCSRVDTLPGCHFDESDPFTDRLLALGYTSVTHRLEYFGVCAVCQKKPSHSNSSKRTG